MTISYLELSVSTAFPRMRRSRNSASTSAVSDQSATRPISGCSRPPATSRSGVALTAAGRRFLGPARKALAAGDLATAAASREERPLRIDVWGHLFAPMRTVQQALRHAPGLDVELGPGRDLPAVISALSRGEIDAGFGRVHPADVPDGDLAHRLVRLEPVDAILGPGHPLATDPAAAEVARRHGGYRCLGSDFPELVGRLQAAGWLAGRFRTHRHDAGTRPSAWCQRALRGSC